jgi:hypothetical protein
MTEVSDDGAQVKVTVRGVTITDMGKLRVGVTFSLKQEDGWTESATLDVVLPDEGQTLTEIKDAAIARGRAVLARLAGHPNP